MEAAILPLLRGHRGQALTRVLLQYTPLAVLMLLLALLGVGKGRIELRCHLRGERERQEGEHSSSSRQAAAKSQSLQQICYHQMNQSVDLAVDQSHVIHTHHHKTSHMIGHMTQLPLYLHTVISHMTLVVMSSAANRPIRSVKMTPFLRNR